ncbi:MAG: type III pantothenate kinase [Candidatus Brocadiia bacterium]
MPEGETTVSLVGVDIGNTSVKIARRTSDGWQAFLRVPTTPVDELADRIRAELPEEEREHVAESRCVACSVHPAANEPLTDLWGSEFGTAIEFFGRDLPVPLPTTVREPEKVGTDRLLLALGAVTLHGAPCIVVSAGTAVTVDLVDAEGRFAGGAIAPGLRLAADALERNTALLPHVRLGVPSDIQPGRDTVEAIQRGVYWSCAGGVLALLGGYRTVAGSQNVTLVCSGSDARLLLPALPREGTVHEPLLIFHGMEAALR